MTAGADALKPSTPTAILIAGVPRVLMGVRLHQEMAVANDGDRLPEDLVGDH